MARDSAMAQVLIWEGPALEIGQTSHRFELSYMTLKLEMKMAVRLRIGAVFVP